MTWPEIAERHPEFVQWVVQTYGPLPEGEVEEADYKRLAAIYEAVLESRTRGG